MNKLTEFKMGDVEDPHLYAQLHIQELKENGTIPDYDTYNIYYKLSASDYYWHVDVFQEEKENACNIR